MRRINLWLFPLLWLVVLCSGCARTGTVVSGPLGQYRRAMILTHESASSAQHLAGGRLPLNEKPFLRASPGLASFEGYRLRLRSYDPKSGIASYRLTVGSKTGRITLLMGKGLKSF
ncbi:hypothetical protein BH11ARM2_BH11ARM2_29640 [soil metagenome]